MHGGYALVRKGWRVSAEHDLCGCGGEVRETGDWEIFVVEGGVVAEDFVGLGASLLALCCCDEVRSENEVNLPS